MKLFFILFFRSIEDESQRITYFKIDVVFFIVVQFFFCLSIVFLNFSFQIFDNFFKKFFFVVFDFN